MVSGSSVAAGYWRDTNLTNRRFIEGWWRSGDLGHIDADGYVWIDGRVDNVINTGGIKVHAEEIEEVIKLHPAIRDCAVVGKPDESFGQRIEAYVILGPERVDIDELVNFLREKQQMAGFKIPKRFNFVEVLPVGATGKIDRKALALQTA